VTSSAGLWWDRMQAKTYVSQKTCIVNMHGSVGLIHNKRYSKMTYLDSFSKTYGRYY
jgi:hypothetical protein